MYQAGIKNIVLYENKNISFRYYDSLNEKAITLLTGDGAIITLDNIQQPSLDINILLTKEGRVAYEYVIDFLILGFNSENITYVEDLKYSIYGWCFLVNFYDGTSKYYNTPLNCMDIEVIPSDEMIFKCKLETPVLTNISNLDYSATAPTIVGYRADTTLITTDSTLYTADYYY